MLKEPYDYERTRTIVREMTELLVLDLVRKGLVTKQVTLSLSYDRESLFVLEPGDDLKGPVYGVKTTGKAYSGTVTPDYYGRPHPKHAHGTGNLPCYTSSTRRIMETMMALFDRIADPELLSRRVNITAEGILPEKDIPAEQTKGVVEGQFDLFSMMDTEEKKAEKEAEGKADQRERRLQDATLKIHGKYGKNALLRGTNFREGATTRERNRQIGGHRSGD